MWKEQQERPMFRLRNYSPKRIFATTIISLIMSDSYQALRLYQKDLHLEKWWGTGLMNFTFVAGANY